MRPSPKPTHRPRFLALLVALTAATQLAAGPAHAASLPVIADRLTVYVVGIEP